jgi:arabinose-5-phosphate isomerase
MTDTLGLMRDTLRAEAAALTATIDLVDEGWARAIDIFDGVRKAGQRLIVCGVGKSGHVGKKIAASLASTGTPSFFVHGTEASHGDLGMIQPGDAVLMITASGGTAELVDTASYCRARGIPLVLITRNPDSRVGRYADIVLRLPNVPEACTIGMAPTTSSTATLAIGDAITVALMSRAGFAKADFGRYHPGGKLGDATRRAIDVMTAASALRPLPADATLRMALREVATGASVRIEPAGEVGPAGATLCADGSALMRLAAETGDLSAALRTILPRSMPQAEPTALVSDIKTAQPDAATWGIAVVDKGQLVGYVPANLI